LRWNGRGYVRKAREATTPSDKNMYTCLADGYMRLADAYDKEAEVLKGSS